MTAAVNFWITGTTDGAVVFCIQDKGGGSPMFLSLTPGDALTIAKRLHDAARSAEPFVPPQPSPPVTPDKKKEGE